MPTPVEVTCVRKSGPGRIEALGGVWNGQPWSMSERNLIVEIEQPDDRCQWNFFARIAGAAVPVIIRVEIGRKHLSAGSDPIALLRLPEIPQEQALGWEV
jgi:hypothetical protein